MKSKTLGISLLAAATTMFLSSCSTIHFQNGPAHPSAEVTASGENWHHDGALALVEFSDPEDLHSLCGNGSRWATVTTQQNPIQSILTVITATLYAPWDVQYSCIKQARYAAPMQQMRKHRRRKRAKGPQS